jgi:hypothetical protein
LKCYPSNRSANIRVRPYSYSGTECAEGFVRDFFIDAGGTGDIYLENLNVKAVGIVNSSNYRKLFSSRHGGPWTGKKTRPQSD